MKNIFFVLLIIILIAALAGCEKYTSGYSVNPLLASDADASSLFVGAELGFTIFSEGLPSQVAALWAQQLTGGQNQYVGYQGYVINSQDFDADWVNVYTGGLSNLKLTESKATADGNMNLRGAARILEGIQMGTVAALWGDVPYSQACNPAFPTPVFDPQDTVYAEVQSILNQGIADLASPSVISKDMTSYAGDVTLWKLAAYSAKARYLMHVARHDGYPAADLNAIIAAANQGIIAVDGTQDLMFTHTTAVQGQSMNMWYSFDVVDRAGYIDAASTFVIPMMQAASFDHNHKSNESGRLSEYFNSTLNDINTTTGLYQAASPYPVIRASETLLLMAEAYARLGNTTSAIGQLNQARLYANTVFGNTSVNFVASDFATPAALLQTIYNEEYLALMHQIEVINFLRRINYQISYHTAGVVTADTVITMEPTPGQTQFPERYFYTASEINANTHTPIQGSSDLFVNTAANTP